MAKYRIAYLPGDGVGPEVLEAARMVLDAVGFSAEYVEGDVGWEFWCKEGNPLPERTIEILKNTDACLFGAITSKPKDEAEKELAPELRGRGLSYFSPIVALRQMFDLYANVRPCRAFPGNPLNFRDDIDLVVFRENTEGLYSGVEFHPVPDEVREALSAHSPKMQRFSDVPADELAISCRIFTRRGCERIVRAAFEYAKKHGYPTVTVVEKPNVIRETSGLMVRVAREVAKDYPGIDLWETNVDAMCMWLVKNPQDYGVLVSSNMFGDIISDLAAQLVGGLGFAAAGNIGEDYAVFEPTHGSAPKYAGKYRVNPTAAVLAAKMMLDWLGETEKAQRIQGAVAQVIAEGKVRTYDMGGDASTLQMAEAIAEKAGR
ncbi:isocitrate/isopropylmalate dehydrogenase family protein [Candidatus Bipolaricaulota bacterium]|nr:isocitrate/isopropylmalate dehydrogenase family protein [Candidatus Bipolaricaulota bacterium]